MRIGGKLNEFKKPTQHKNWVGFFHRGKYKALPGDAKVEVDYQKCLAVLLHRFFDLYSDSAFFVCVNSSPRIALPLPRRTILSFGGEAAVGFQYLLVVYRHRARGYSLSCAERESENISPATASSRGDATVMLVSFIFTCGARTSPSGIKFAFSVARPAPVQVLNGYILRRLGHGRLCRSVGLNADVSDALAGKTETHYRAEIIPVAYVGKPVLLYSHALSGHSSEYTVKISFGSSLSI